MTDQAKRGADPTELFASMLGVWYPRDYVVGVIDDLDAARRAEAALRSACPGAQGIRVITSDEFRLIGEAVEGSKSALQRLIGTLSRGLTDEGIALQDTIDATRAGHHVIAVFAPGPGDVERSAEVLTAHGAHDVRYYGARSIRDLRRAG